MINRRDFLQGMLYMSIAGKFGYDEYLKSKELMKIQQLKREQFDLEEMIFHTIPKHVYKGTVKATVNYGVGDEEVQREFYGVMIDKQYITCAHNFNVAIKRVKGLFKTITILGEVKERTVSINDYKLELDMENIVNDTARFNVPKETVFPNFPTELNYHPKLGEDVYIIGNPMLTGVNIRHANISNMDGFKEEPLTTNSFGIDKVLVPGDSGTPCVDVKGRLLGLNSFRAFGAIGYVKRIGEYLK